MPTDMDSTTIVLAYGISVDAAALHLACEARVAVQPILDFFSLFHLRRRMGTLTFSPICSSSSSTSTNLSVLPPELLGIIQDEVFCAARAVARAELRKRVGTYGCTERTGEVCGIDKSLKECECCHDDHRQDHFAALADALQNRVVEPVLRMYRLTLCSSARLASPDTEPFITPAIVGIPLRPRQSSIHPAKEAPPHLSNLEANEEEQDQTRFFHFGSALAPLNYEQKGRFRRLVIDLKLGRHLFNKGLTSTCLEDGEAEAAARDELVPEFLGEPSLIVVHSAEFHMW